MKAAVLNAINTPLEIQNNFSLRALKKGEVLVRLQASALNHRDLWITKGLYAGIKVPIILGSDGAGKIIQYGPETTVTYKDEPVVINPGLNWGDSEKGQGIDYQILGLPQDGTFAEEVIVPLKNVVPIPKHMDSRQAAAISLAGLTAYRALFSRGQMNKGDKVLITGIGGGVALIALQFASAAGGEVWVTSSSEDKIAFALKTGARGGVNYRNSEWHKELLAQNGGGFDLVIDGSGGEGIGRVVDLMNTGGRIVMYGGTAGKLPELVPQKIFWKQLSIMGSTMGSPNDFAAMINFISFHHIVPVISDEFTLEEVNSALQRMDSGKQTGKIVLNIL